MIKKVMASIVSITFFLNICQACSCVVRHSFVNGMIGNETIVEVTILGHKVLPKLLIQDELSRTKYSDTNGLKQSKTPYPPLEKETYTKLLVEEMYFGKLRSDTIVFYNGNGANCYASINKFPVGSKFIIKMRLGKNEYGRIERLKRKHAFIFNHPMYTASDCEIWKLGLNGGMIKGYVSNNKKFDLLDRANYDDKLSEQERKDLFKQAMNIKDETFTKEEFRNILEKKAYSLDK